MANIKDLYGALNWRLLQGGHDFPGPDGGTCINEAAVVVAGLRYRKIMQASDCPSCFSPVLATYAFKINDAMPDNLRQELLLPFVTRLACTRDTDEIERQRADIIVIRTVSKILPIVLRWVNREKQALACEAVTTFAQAQTAANAAAYAADAADAAAYAAATYRQIWREAAAILDAAMAIGKQAEPIERALIVERIKQAVAGE